MTAHCAGIVRRILGALALLVTVSGGAAALEPLPVDETAVIAAAVATGMLQDNDFDAIDDPFAGPLLVGRPGASDGSAVSLILFRGKDGPEQIQLVLQAPWGDMAEKMELAGALLRLLVTVPDPNPTVVETPAFADMSREAQWVLGLLSEAWAGWPGSPSRQVRGLGGIAVIAEGNPPDNWVLTIAVDAGYEDANWPGPDPAGESERVAEARLALRAGDYPLAHAILRRDGLQEDPPSLALLGDLFRFGRLGRTDQQTATNYYLTAGRVQYAPAVYALATMSDIGYGVLTLDGIRYPLLERAAANGSADALYLLSGAQTGVFYQRPEGVTPLDQVTEAAMMGLLAAQIDLANRHADGDGVEADPVAACAWALVAVANTDPGVDWIRSRALAAEYEAALSADQLAEARALADRLLAEIAGS